jgi:ubiquinol-cytochrome c reductase iron-sulfur subunit
MKKNEDNEDIDWQRRKLLKAGICILGGIGAAATLYPLMKSLEPTADQVADNGPIKADISKLNEGEQITLDWHGKPVWIIRRTQSELAELRRYNPELLDPSSTSDQQPTFARNDYRSQRPEILVLVGLCTHLGCIPNFCPKIGSIAPNWEGGFLCPCHGSRYDLSGRVFKNMPAPLNLLVPPYHFTDEHTVVIGS